MHQTCGIFQFKLLQTHKHSTILLKRFDFGVAIWSAQSIIFFRWQVRRTNIYSVDLARCNVRILFIKSYMHRLLELAKSQ